MRSSIHLLIALAVLAPLRANANTGTIAIVGKSDAHARDVTGQAAAAALQKAGWQLADKPLSESERSSITRCFTREEPQRCILRLVQDRGVQGVAYISVDPDPSRGERGLKLTGRVVASKLDLVLNASRFCDHCTDDTLTAAATALVKDLLDSVALTAGRTVLSIKSSPQGARYAVDGSYVGVTDASIDVTPGPHTVTVELEGFETFVQNVRATEGSTAEVNAVFRNDASDDRPPTGVAGTTTGTAALTSSETGSGDHRARRSWAAKPLLIGGGLAIAAGTVALFFDQGPSTSPAQTEQPQFYYDTTLPGAVAIAGGALLVGVGAYLYWRTPGSSTTASLRPTPNGTMLTLGASF